MSNKVAFIGLGVMGFPMAGYISKAGHDVTVYNRTAAKAEKWAQTYKGNTASTPAEAAKEADFVFTCVGNDNDLKEVTTGPEGAFQNVKKGAVFIDNTTASAKVARELFNIATEKGFGFLDAPVSGGQAGAGSTCPAPLHADHAGCDARNGISKDDQKRTDYDCDLCEFDFVAVDGDPLAPVVYHHSTCVGRTDYVAIHAYTACGTYGKFTVNRGKHTLLSWQQAG